MSGNTLLFISTYILSVHLALFVLWAVSVIMKFRVKIKAERTFPAERAYPFVSVIKPLKGTDVSLRENLESFFRQDYPGGFEIIFSVASDKDPCIETITGLKKAYPRIQSRLVVSEPLPSVIEKISNLESALKNASADILIFADADVFLDSRDCLKKTIPYLEMPGIACVCAGYNQQYNAGDLISGLSAAYTNWGSFCLQLLNQYDNYLFLGGFWCVKRGVLDKIGGFTGLGGYISEDFSLARKIIEGLKLKCVFMLDTVKISSRKISFGEWRQQIRRYLVSCKLVSPLLLQMVFSIFSISCFIGFIYFAFFSTEPWSGLFSTVLFTAYLLRVMPVAAFYALQNRMRINPYFLLLPIIDILSIIEALAFLFGRHIIWKGKKYRMRLNGRIKAVME